MSARIENWFHIKYNGELCLAGYVYDHPKKDGDLYKDGHRVITSKIISTLEGAVQTRNTLYILGEEAPIGGEVFEYNCTVGRITFNRLLPVLV